MQIEAYQDEFSVRLKRAMQLTQAYAHVDNISLEEVEALVAELLDLPNVLHDNKQGCSGLNADQAPLQLCITLRKDAHKCRFIADPASDDPNYFNRYGRAKNVLWKTVFRSNASGLKTMIEDMLSIFGPKDEIEIKNFTYGVFWLAASVSEKGIAMYIDTSGNEIDPAWDKAIEWFSEKLRNTAAIKVVEAFRPYSWLSSVGIEGYDMTKSKLKLYIKALKIFPEGFLGNLFPQVSLLGTSKCFQILLRDIGLSHESIFYNIGIHPENGRIIDMKLDISENHLLFKQKEAEEAIYNCSQALGLQYVPINSLMNEYNLAISFIGIGVNYKGEPRLNIYLKGRD